jgi:hypothetical protein
MRVKNVQHSLRILGFAPRSNSSLHLHFVIHPVLFILCFSDVKRVISPHHSSCIYCPFIHRIVNLFMWAMYSAIWVIYSSSSRWQLVILLGYLFYVRPFRVSCVIFAIHFITH